MEIRPATLDDLDFMERCANLLYESERIFEPSLTYVQGQYREGDGKEISNPNALVLIAETDQPIGYLYAYLEDVPKYFSTSGKQCIVEVIFVEAKARCQGIAAQLLKACLSWAKTKKAKRVISNVFADNKSSSNVFAKEGFREHHVTMLLELGES